MVHQMEAAVYRDPLSVRLVHLASEMVVDRRPGRATHPALSEPPIPRLPLSTEDDEPLRVDIGPA